jgi:PAS domain S-box-containing protein
MKREVEIITENNFRMLFEKSLVGMALIDFETGEFIEVNNALLSASGYTKEEFLSLSFWNLTPGEYEEQENRQLKDLNENGCFGPNVKEYIRKDGTRYPISISGSLFLDSRNKKVVWGILEDISARAGVDEVLKKSQDALKKLLHAVEQSPVVTFITNLSGVIEYINPKAIELSGYTREELVGNTPRIFKSGIQSLGFYKVLWETISSGREWKGELQNKKKNGDLFWVLESISTVRDYMGNATHYIAVQEDITERKLAEAILIDSENMYRSILHASAEGILIVDAESLQIIFANPTQCEMLGYTEEELISMTIIEIHPKESIKETLTEFQSMLLGEKAFVSNIQCLKKNGATFFADIHSSFLFQNGRRCILGFFKDITERTKGEEHLKKLSQAVEQSSVLTFITDLSGAIEYANPKTSELTGYSKEELIGQNPRIFKSGAQSADAYKILWQTISSGNQWKGELQSKKKNGEYYWAMASISPIFNSLGEISNYLGMQEDITERKRDETEILNLNASLENKIEIRTNELRKINESLYQEIEVRKIVEFELRKARKEADDANQAKSEFLSRMSHELRTPMNSILGFAQLMEMGDLPLIYKKGVNHILKSGKHLLDLINEVLDISRIEAGQLSLSLEPIHLQPVILEILDIVQPHADKRNLTLELIDSPANQLFVRSDNQRLKQVLLNLLNNAIKYNSIGGSVIVNTEIRKTNDSEFSVVRISISDTGIGIKPEDYSKLFNPFERIGAEKTETEGTGLGLMVVKKLMEAMGGNIGVDSISGKGTTFWIELRQVESQKTIFEQSITEILSEESGPVYAGTILYIEDNRSNAELFEEIILTHRPTIRLGANKSGQQAVKLAIDYAADLILLDLDLPDIHGSEVLFNLQTDPLTKDIPVVIVSANAMPKQIEHLLSSGAREYLTKPIEVKGLLRVIDNWVGERS